MRALRAVLVFLLAGETQREAWGAGRPPDKDAQRREAHFCLKLIAPADERGPPASVALAGDAYKFTYLFSPSRYPDSRT